MNPTSHEDWLAVARERAADAVAMMPKRNDSVGPVYMVGYAIECCLKAYLQRSGIRLPGKGPEGHNLVGLWKRTGFRLSDLSDKTGAKAFYLQSWSTDLRYHVNLNIQGLSIEDLIMSAKQLTGWLHEKVRRLGQRK